MVFELKVLRIHKKNEVVDWVGAISSGWLKLPCQGEVRNDDMAISFLGPSSLSASDFALRAAPGQVAVEVFILNCVSNEDWSGRSRFERDDFLLPNYINSGTINLIIY